MFEIARLTVEGLENNIVTDKSNPHISYKVASDGQNVHITNCHIVVRDQAGKTMWETDTTEQIEILYEGEKLKPSSEYTVDVAVKSDTGEEAFSSIRFTTGLMSDKWPGTFITDGSYSFTEKKVSPEPMTFRKKIRAAGNVVKAYVYATAMGIYEMYFDGEKVGDRYFAPGFTSYKKRLQYQTYDVTEYFNQGKEINVDFTVSGGWAVGSFIYSRNNRFAADRQALSAMFYFVYDNGEADLFGTDSSWLVTRQGKVKMADLYDGETFDSTVKLEESAWKNAEEEKLKYNPQIIAECGAPVTEHEVFLPLSEDKKGEEIIYDFGQNFAGIVRFTVKNAKKGQVIEIRHAEILNPDGTLNTSFLRSAKATVTYICSDGEQIFSPSFTYMGFRYVAVKGVKREDFEIKAIALYSDMADRGSFECSDEMINKLQSNIRWSTKSNFVDIPTDCPQRDERMGWTGDIAVFSTTACFNFDTGRFLKKWLGDVRSEQLPTGGLPNTVPANGFGFPVTMPTMAIDWWGDACVLVPWALYMSDGDISVLKDNYDMMKKYVGACRRWAAAFSLGKNRFIWHTPSIFHFGDWVAPDAPKMPQWQKRSKWTATASLYNTSSILANVAEILGHNEDAKEYRKLSENVADAYECIFTDGNGRLKEEFQTAYVLPIQFGMFKKENRKKAVDNLVKLIEKNNYCIGTGFPGTPYILFALADNGRADVAYKMLLNTKCPSWLYEVRTGATTIWERWDGLDENGQCPIGDDGTGNMISYNHYASGAVGDFLYKRVAGIEPLDAGYKKFRIKPVLGGNLTYAKAKIDTSYGVASSEWRIEDSVFSIDIEVPVGCQCILELPDGKTLEYGSGHYSAAAKL
ncbi:alpha-L-rhamnosidase [Butyrivibrio proteoclasticus]|uniref:alpha-L-rhamnosidase n=1 Tax=Butyrivibrio proteoclasticus TaxID=43305 RepID=A0A1I5TJP1_9FIRM|nr:alpha-L-rhamnosidase [Butyrivibrio proteoclasticus]SFP83270.1 alpha-L-rhamnosidase [Butyrivibrio proteoclasticus]